MRRALAALTALLLAGGARAEPVEAGAGLGAAGIEGCRTDLRYLNQLFGWQASWQRQWAALQTASDDDLRAAIATWRAAPAALRADQAGLAQSIGEPAAAPRVIAMRRFHDVVIGRGSRRLDQVYADVVRWADRGGRG